MNNTFKILLTSILAAFPILGYTVDYATGPNSVYIEQLGSSNTVTIEQVGGTNKVGGTNSTNGAWDDPSSSNYGTINGSSNVVTITQTGNNNMNQYNIKGGDNVYTSTVTGSGNRVRLSVGDANTNSSNNTITETVVGDTNTLITTLVGGNNTSTTTIKGLGGSGTGSSNNVTKDITTSGATNDVTIYGSNNNVYSEQRDAAGGSGHSLTLVSDGGYNTYSVQQQGTNDTTVNVQTTGSHNTVTVRTSNTAIVSPLTATAR